MPPFSLIPFGQCTMVPLRVPPQCEATCLVHWYGESIAQAQPTAKWPYEPSPPNSSSLDIMNSGVSIAGHAVEVRHLVEGALERALGRRAVVADDQVDQRVVEDVHVLERIDQPADVMVGVLHERGVDLHLALEHRLELRIHVVPGRDLLVARRQLGVGGR